ncbi:GNAT family N-acetyltransferase [Enterococcus faecium]|uniref:GNAT family N-acetyltransferase n=1 Tax=Enterococcus faecium TaxID=1352 RepID=UPI0030C9DD37
MTLIIREFNERDFKAVTELWNDTVKAGIFFPQENQLNSKEAKIFFAEQSYVGIAELDNEIVGLYILHPNSIGRCGHIANSSYAVKNGKRGNHIGEELVKNSLEIARKLSFRLLQFNAVVVSNFSAIHLYKKLGFKELGRIPDGFRLDNGTYEDIISFYIELTN